MASPKVSTQQIPETLLAETPCASEMEQASPTDPQNHPEASGEAEPNDPKPEQTAPADLKAKAAPADPRGAEIPVKAGPADSDLKGAQIPVKAAPADLKIPVKAASADLEIPVKAASADLKMPVKAASADLKIPVKAAPANLKGSENPAEAVPADLKGPKIPAEAAPAKLKEPPIPKQAPNPRPKQLPLSSKAAPSQPKEQEDEYDPGEDTVLPPPQVSKATLMKRLARLCAPREDGTYKIPMDVIETYKNLGSRDEVYRSFEKCGCDPVPLSRLNCMSHFCFLQIYI